MDEWQGPGHGGAQATSVGLLRARAPGVAPIRHPPSPHAAAYRVFVRSNCVPNVLNAWSATNEYFGALYGLHCMFS